jgi:hypothetical protein
MPKYPAKTYYTSAFFGFCLFVLSLVFLSKQVEANNSQVLGMHILHPGEIDDVRRVYADEAWRFVTIPLTLDDLSKRSEWQKFFDQAAMLRLIPIVRLNTRYDPLLDAWVIPSRKDIIDLARFLSSLNWHQDEKFIIVFNEVNHAKEWGGKIDPLLYTSILRFTSDWFRSEERNYKILPAAMDLAAPNGAETREAFTYLNSMLQFDSEIFDKIDYWNSHSYPNPDFAASPKRTGQNSLRGFLHELTWLKNKTGRDFEVMITETGWASSYLTNYQLSEYYLYALNNIWNDERVKAVTPFIMRGSPGPFASFSFFDAAGNPTIQLFALQKALKTFDAVSF